MEELDVHVYLEFLSNKVYILTKGMYNVLIAVNYDCVNKCFKFNSVERVWFRDVKNKYDCSLERFIIDNRDKFEGSEHVKFVDNFNIEGEPDKLSDLTTNKIIKKLIGYKSWYNGGVLI